MGKGENSPSGSLGIQSYYQAKVEELEIVHREKLENLRRLEAQRNELNMRVRSFCEEL